jgi:hypothetical protein
MGCCFLVPAISTRTELAKDAIPVSKHPMGMAGTGLDKPGHDGVSGACSTSTARAAGISCQPSRQTPTTRTVQNPWGPSRMAQATENYVSTAILSRFGRNHVQRNELPATQDLHLVRDVGTLFRQRPMQIVHSSN